MAEHPPAPPVSSASAAVSAPVLIDAADHPMVMRWMTETARRQPDAFARFVGPNVPRAKALFGRANWRGRGGLTHGWTLSEAGLSWFIQTGPDGTIFWWRSRQDAAAVLRDQLVGSGAVAVLARWMRLFTEDVSR